jgi:hypothetical protein
MVALATSTGLTSRMALNLSRIDIKRGDHFLQADFIVTNRAIQTRIGI